MRVLVTGACGFVGSEIMRHCLMCGYQVLAVIRPRYGLTAEQRFERLWNSWLAHGMIQEALRPNAGVLSLDIARHIPQGMLCSQEPDIIIHAAAETDFQAPLMLARQANVTTTQRMVTLARSLQSRPRFVHISTAFVCGKAKGQIDESYAPRKFYNSYEQSKAEAERVVRGAGIPFLIVRPSIIVGDSKTGYTTHFRVLYSLFRLWFLGVLPRAPLDFTAQVDLVPVDYVVKATMHLAVTSQVTNEVIHLCAGRSVTVRAIVEACREVFCEREFRFSPLITLRVLSCPAVKPLLPASWQKLLEIAAGHFPYMGRKDRFFITRKADTWLHPANIVCPKFEEFSRVLFTYCQESNWGKRKVVVTRSLSTT